MKDDKPIPRISAHKYRGAGDLIAAVAIPIAKAADKILGTNLQNCHGCAKRREKFNELVPFPLTENRLSDPDHQGETFLEGNRHE